MRLKKEENALKWKEERRRERGLKKVNRLSVFSWQSAIGEKSAFCTKTIFKKNIFFPKK